MNRINQIIAGRYIIKELIGQGGMADVYLGEDRILKRTVAIKLLRSSLTGDPVYVTRFHREASAASSLCHKNIVQIYDVGEEDDLYYIVMEYVPGQQLKDLIHKRGALHYVEAIDIMKQIVSATAMAHSRGIIHRDLKPQNVLVTDSGVVKITDFGIASIQSLSQVTQSDTIMGSLHYLAPEIARGEKATVQSDIYALGIVFYELLRGEVPFNGESPVNIALKHMRDDIPSLLAFNPTIPQSVENIVIKATAKNTKNRYNYASEMLEDLENCLYHKDDPKLVFDIKEEDPTIVADNEKFFTKDNKKEEIQPQEKNTNKKNKKKNKKKKYIIIGSIVTCLVVACIVFAFIFFQNDTFAMPNLIGLKEDEALEILDDKELKYDKDNFKEELSDEYDKGIVINSSPISNSSVSKGDEVILTISSGKYIVINDYTGSSYDDAKKELEDKGFTVLKEETNSEEKINTVIRQSINPTEEYDPNTKEKEITLTVSKGEQITVPNVYGQSISSAKSLLESSDYGFTVKLQTLTPPTSASEIESMQLNVVYKQSIAAFTKLTKKSGRSITLYYYDKKPEIQENNNSENNESNNTTENNTNETE